MHLVWAVVTLSATAVLAWPWATPSQRPAHDEARSCSSNCGSTLTDVSIFQDMLSALHNLQDVYFQRWVGTWPKGIDWTRAVMATHVAAALRTISDQLVRELKSDNKKADSHVTTTQLDTISLYFTDLVAYYFGEDAFAIRNQAYDDMLWVVLGWLESIQFVHNHGKLLAQYPSLRQSSPAAVDSNEWYGHRWIPAFAHRARVFWELAAKGWDTKLCGGGMIWNPRLLPYKNAITNELFIAASIGMYLHFPGDENDSPYTSNIKLEPPNISPNFGWHAHDPVFGSAAQRGHDWLRSSNMTNDQGLYADGFHVSGLGKEGNNNTRCDDRDEMVYTYNQGVILSGLLGLFQATGQEHYLHEGHALILNVIAATGWDLTRNKPLEPRAENLTFFLVREGKLPRWHGLGRAGILEDACDMRGSCSQDAQTFKGIWMHHFATFCAPDALEFVHPRAGLDEQTLERIRDEHAAQCKGYLPWLRRNAKAALGTRDENGLFGMWWTPGLLVAESGGRDSVLLMENVRVTDDALPPRKEGEVDYRNEGVPQDEVWMEIGHVFGQERELPPVVGEEGGQRPLGGSGRQMTLMVNGEKRNGTWSGILLRKDDVMGGIVFGRDPNVRGRGRTVETQGGGLAVLRALWVVSRNEA